MLSAEVEARAPQFDFQAHRSKSVDQFRAVRGVYEAFVNAVREILLGAIPHELQIHSIEARAKALDSFAVKACLPSNGDSSAPQYPKPMDQITDLAGVRVIAFFRKTLESLNEIIRAFSVIM